MLLVTGLLLWHGADKPGPASSSAASAHPSPAPQKPQHGRFILDRQKEKLKEVDLREARSTVQPKGDRKVALEALRKEVPGVQVDFDPITGAPSHIMAAGKFLARAAQNAKDPYQPVRDFVSRYKGLFGHDAEALAAGKARVTREDVTAHNGMRTVVWQQEVAGIPVFQTILKANLTKEGDLLTLGSHFMADAARSAAAQTALAAAPTLSAPQALTHAAASLGLELDTAKITHLTAPEGAEQSQKLKAPSYSDTTAHLTWVPMAENQLRLAWEIETFSLEANDMVRVVVDVEDQRILVRQSLGAEVSNASFRVFTGDSPAPMKPGPSTPQSTQGTEVPRTLVTLQAYNLTASPDGWVPDGQNGTVGNNVDAHLDTNADNVADLPLVQGTNRTYDFTFNSSAEPTTYQAAAVTQLFYYNNWVHDRLYELGFTETAGNFQTNNFGRGGLGSDAVQADAQDGSGTNNANFYTPSDGAPGRMQMYIWPGPTPDRDCAFDGDIVIHEYGHGVSNRLVGGGVGIFQWQSRGMGEGWSDFYAVALQSKSTDPVDGVYAMSGYSTYQLSGMTTNYYFGIRRYPYCTDMTKAPLTYKDIDPTRALAHTGVPLSPRYSASNQDPAQYHAQGEVWCNMLMECRANLITHHGWAVGNEMMLRLVTDGLKLTPANPTFIQARDAIIQADLVNNAGADAARLWAGFAKRGMGASASGPDVTTTTGVIEAYDIPDDLSVTPFGTLAATGTVGGAITPASQAFTLQNLGASTINWTAQTNQPWLVLSRTAGSLGPAGTDPVTLSFGPAATGLSPGSYTGRVSFTNTDTGAVLQREVSLTMEPLRITLLSEPFDSPTLSASWTITGTNTYRTQVTAQDEPRASYHLTMDSSVDGTYSRNEATVTVNLAGQHDVELSFWAKSFADEANGPPASPFLNGADFDGVAISADGGTSWYEVQPLRSLTSSWTKYTVDLDAATASLGLAYTSNFKIRFNQYDNYGIATDGIAIDDILVAQTINNSLALALPVNTVTEGVAPVTATLAITPMQTSPLTVTLTSSSPDVSVPASITVPAGLTQITFPVTVVDDALLDGSQSVTLTAAAPAFSFGTTTLTVHDNETTSLAVDAPLSVTEGAVGLAAFVNVPTPVDAPVTVALESSNPTVTLPASVIIPAGQTSAQFYFTVANDPYINGSRSVTFTASVTGWTPGVATTTIQDDESGSLVLAQMVPSLLESDGVRAKAARVSINGLTQTDVVIALSSSDSSQLTVPASVTLRAGSTEAAFDLTLLDDSDADGPQSVTLTASAAGFTTGTLAVTVNDDEGAPVAWNPRPAHLSVNNPVNTDLAWTASEGNLIVNGDFETGTLAGWSFNAKAPVFRVQNGLLDPAGNDTPTPPWRGSASMIFAPASSTGTWVMHQDVAVPPDGPAPVLQWVQRIRNTGSTYSATQQYRVEIRDAATDAVLATPFATATGNALFQDWAAQSADLSAWRGRSVRVAFVVVQGSAVLNVLLDDISLQQRPAASTFDVYFGTTPTLGQDDLLGSTPAPAWNLPTLTPGTTYYWQVITRNGTQTVPSPVWQFTVPAAGKVASFAWSAIASPQTAYTDIPITVTALDALGNVASGFTGQASLSALLPGVTRSGVLITEHNVWSTDEFEFTNVSSAAIDISGWKVVLTQVNSFPAPYLTVTIPAGTPLPAGGIFRVQEGGTAPGTFPLLRTGLSTNLGLTSAAYVVLANAQDEVMDFVCTVGDPRRAAYPLPAEAWAGSSLPSITTAPAGQSYQRVGRSDTNTAADWQLLPATSAALNTGLVLPFAAPAPAPAVVPPQTASFTAGVWSGNARVLSAGQNLRLRATEPGGKQGDSALFTVAAPNGKLALTTGATVAEGAGTAASFGTVTLPAPAAVPVTVSFNVEPASQASVADVTIPAGATSAAFDLTVMDDALLEGPHNITLTAIAPGCTASDARTVAVTDDETATLTLAAPVTANENAGTSAGAVTLTASAAPVNPITLILSSSDTTEATLPATVTLPAGQTNVAVELTLVDDALLDGPQTVTLTASAAGFTPGSHDLVVADNEPSTLTLTAPATLAESAGTVPAAATVTLGGQAPADLTVTLLSSDPDSLTTPASVTVLAGQTSATFALTVVNDATPEANASVTLTARVTGLTDATATTLVRDDDLAAFAFASIPSPQKAATGFAATITARNTSGDLLSGFTGTATLAAPGNTVTPTATTAFSGGTWTGIVTLRDPATGQTVTATAGSATGTSAAFDVGTGALGSFVLGSIPSPQTAAAPFTLTATATDVVGRTLTDYAGPTRLVQLSSAKQTATSLVSTSNSTTMLQTSGYNRQRSVMLVRASELGGSMLYLTSLGVHFTSQPPPLARFVIRLKPTTSTTLSYSSAWDNSGWQTVYDAPWNLNSAGWVDVAFSAPYIHNGTSNMLIEFIHAGPTNGAWNGALTSTYLSFSYGAVTAAVPSSSTVNADPLLWAGTTPTNIGSSYRPVFRFGSRVVRDASPATLASFASGVFAGPASALYGGADQALAVWDEAAGVISASNDFTVSSAGTLSLAFSGNATEGGADVTATLTASTAPVADLVVALTASNATDVTLPATVTIPAGSKTAIFTLAAVDDTLLETQETAVITAIGQGYDPATASLTVADNDSATLSVTLPASVTEGGASGTGTVTASAPALYPVTIALAAAPAGQVTIPASVTLPAGQTSATFSIAAVNNTVIDGTRSTTVTASTAGWTSGSAALDVMDNEPLTLTVNVALTSVAENAGTLSGSVSLSGSTPTALTVNLASDDTSEATVPASVTINAGTSSASFNLTVVDDALTDGTQPVTITATAAGFQDGTRLVQILDNEVASLAFATVPGPQIRNTPFSITLRAADINGVTLPSFNGTATLSAAGAGGALAITPPSTGSFVNGVWTGTVSLPQADTGVVLTAQAAGVPDAVSNSFDVLGNGAVVKFAIAPLAATQNPGTPVPVTVTAQDAAGNTVTGYTGSVSFSTSAPTSADVVVGTGTGTTATVLGTAFQRCRNQSIFTAAEVGGARTLRSLALDVSTLPGAAMNKFTIRLKHTTKQDYAATGSGVMEGGGWTTVYQSAQQAVTTTGWNVFNFQNTFVYDGVQNLMVDISFDNASSSTYGYVRYTTTPASRAVYAVTSTEGDPRLWSSAVNPTITATTIRMNVRFSGFAPVTFTPAASGPFVGGTWSGDMTFTGSGAGLTLRALNTSGVQGTSNAFTLNGTVLDHFDFSTISTPQTAGTPVPVTITARDANNVVVPGFSGPATLAGAEPEDRVQVGTSTTTILNAPLNSSSRTQRTQVIYTTAEVGAIARTLNAMDLYVAIAPGDRLSNFTVRLKHTTKADFTAAGTAVWESAGWTTAAQQELVVPTTGWISIPFTTPFEYDGTHNLMVDFSYSNAASGSVQGYAWSTAASTARVVLRGTDVDEGSPLAWHELSAPVPATSVNVPVARFGSSAQFNVTPVLTGSFNQGAWTGSVTVDQPEASMRLTASADGRAGGSEFFSVDAVGALSLTLAAAAAEGAAPLTATITRSGPTTNALTVALASSDTTEATVDSSVTIPAGAASAAFPVTIVDDSVADGPQNAVITATASGCTAAATTLVVTDNEALSLAVRLPASLSEATTAAGNAYVTINRPAASAVTVALSSNDTTELTVPASVTIPAGATSATFAMTVVNDSLMDGPQTVVVTATAAGYVTGTASTAVQDNETQNITLSSSSVAEGSAPATVNVLLSGTTSGAVPITMTVNDTSELLLAPNTATAGSSSLTVTVAANASSVALAFVPQDDGEKDGNQTVTVTLSAPGFPTQTRFVQVIDDELDRYFIAPVASPQTANAAFGVTVTARNVDDSIITSHNATMSLTAANAAGALAMTPASVSLVNGTGTASALFTTGATGVTITATNAQNGSTQSSVFDVQGTSGLARFDWTVPGGTQPVETPQAVTVTAKDTTGNAVTSYAGPANLKAFATAADVTIGTGTSSWATPLGSLPFGRTQSLYLPAEVGAAKRITGLALNVTLSSSTVLNNFTIRMKHATATAFSSAAWESSDWVTVYQGTRTFSATGWQNTVLTRPFDYDGTSSLMVDISFANSASGTSAFLQYTTASAARSVALNTSTTTSGLPATWTGTTPAGATSTNLLNVRFTNATPVTFGTVSPVQVTVGTGTNTTGTPLGTGYHDQRTQMIYTATEMGGAQNISSVALNVYTPPSQTMNAFTIRMRHTPLADYSASAAWESTGWTTVYSATEPIPAAGWKTFTLSTPFAYDGVNNLMVDICFNNASYTDNGYCRATSTASPRVISAQSDSGYGDPLTWSGTTPYGSTSSNRPNMRFTGVAGSAAPALTPATTGSFSNGVWAGTVTPLTATTSLVLAAEDPATGITGYSPSFNVTSSGTLALTFLNTLAEGNGTVSNGGTVTLPAAAAAPVTVSLSNASPGVLTVPATVTIPAGQTSVAVPVTVINDTIIESAQTAAVTATAPGYTRVTTTANVADNDGGTFTLAAPAEVAEDASSFTATLTASVSSPVPFTVSLTSNDTSELTVPATVTLAANATSATFTVTVVNDTLQDGPQTVLLTASAPNWASGTATVSVTDNDPPPAMTLYTYSLAEGSNVTYNELDLPANASSAVTVTLTSSDPAVLSVPSSITVSSGSYYKSFTTTAPDNNLATGTQFVTITASAPGYRSVAAIVSVTDNDAASYRISNISGTPVAGAPASVTITALAPDGTTVSSFSGTVGLSAASGAGAVPVTPAVSGTFSSGTWSGSVAFNQIASGIVLTATDSQGRTGSSAPFNTTFGTLDHFTWGAVPSPQAASTPFTATVTAKDTYENTVASFTGPAALDALTPAADTAVGNGSTASAKPLDLSYDGARSQMIFLPGEVGGAKILTGLSLNISTVPGLPLSRFGIRLKHTTTPSYSGSASFDNTGLTTVYMRGTETISTTGWRTFQFDTPFSYDGTRNLLVDMVFDNATTASGARCLSTSVSPSRHMTAGNWRTSGYGDPYNWSYANNFTSSTLPNVRFSSATPMPLNPAAATPFNAGVWSNSVAVLQSGTNIRLRASAGAAAGATPPLAVTSAGSFTLSLASTAVEGAAPLTATLTVAAAPAIDLVVPLFSSVPGAATVPSSVTLPAGQTSITFPVTVVDDAVLDGTQTTLIATLLPGYSAGSSSLAVIDDETTTITFTLPAALAENAAATTGTVTLGAAPASDVVLPLASSDTGELTVPASVTIPAGATSATFALTPVDDTVIDFAQAVTITTSMAGWTGASGTVSVTDNEAATLSLSVPSSLPESYGIWYGSVSTLAPVENNTVISLVSADTSEATVLATVTLAAGTSSASCTITIINDTEKDGSQTFAITASAPNFTTATRNLTVTDDDVHNFLISTIGATQIRNQAFSVSFTARDVNNATISSYSGTPALTAKDGATTLALTPGTISFSGGTATSNVTLQSYATNAVLTLTDAAANTASSSNAFAVTYGAHTKFAWNTIASPQTPAAPFSTTITAQDAQGNTVSSFTGTAAISATGLMSVGTAGTTVTNVLYPYYDKARNQVIYTAAEVGAARSITSIALDVTTLPPGAMSNFTVRMRHTSKADYSTGGASWETTGWTTCYQGTLTVTSTGWNTLAFTTPFAFDGAQNVMVDISFNNTSPLWSSGGAVRATIGGASRTQYYNDYYGTNPLAWSGTTNSYYLSSTRPDIRFGSASAVTPSPTTTGSFTAGLWTGNVTIPTAAPNVVLQATSGTIIGISNAFSTNVPLTVTLPASAAESASSVTGTVSIPTALASALVVNLVSSDTTEATPAASTVTIAAGATSASFTLNIVNDTLTDGAQSAIITASATAADNGTATISVTDDDPSTFTWSTITSPKTSGVNFLVTINARTVDNQPATAINGSTAALTATVAGVSKTVSPANTGAFSSASWTGNVSVIGSGTTTLTATSGATTGTSGSFTLSAPTLSVTLPASAAESAGSVSGTVTISAAQAAATTVTLSSNDTTEAAPAASTVTIAAGATSASFTLNIINDTLRDGTQNAVITASASNATSGTATISVLDNDVDNFLVSSVTSQVRNAPFTVTFTARDVNNVVISNYGGSPVLTAMDGVTSLAVSPSTVNSFSSGVRSVSVTVSSYASSAILTLTDPVSGGTGSSNPFAVRYSTAAKFAWSTITQAATGVPFSATLTAQDQYGNDVGNYTGTAGITAVMATKTGTGATSWSYPLSHNSFSNRVQVICTAAELGTAKTFKSLSLNVLSLGSFANSGALTIRMKQTTKSDYSASAAFESTGWTTCYQGSTAAFPGWNTFSFTTPFSYDGAQNVLVDMSLTTGTIPAGAPVSATDAGAPLSVYSNNASGDPLLWSYAGLTSNLRPDFILASDPGFVPSPSTTGAFTSGVWNGSVTLPSQASNLMLQATSGSVSGLSNAFNISAPLLSITLPSTASESAGSVSGTVSLTAALASPFTVNLSSSDTTAAQPATATVTIPAGSTSAGFTLNIINDTLKDGAQNAIVSASAPNATSSTATISVTDDDVHNFLVSTVSGPQVRGAPFNVTFTARDVNNVTITGYNGTPALVAASGGTPLASSPGTVSGFSAGVKVQSVTVGSFAPDAVLTLTDPATGGSGSSNAFAVTFGSASRFVWNTIPQPQIAGTPFPATLTVQDSVGNTVTSYAGSAALTAPLASSQRSVGSNSTASFLPFNTIFPLCRTQQVHLASELGAAGTFTALAFNVTGLPVAETLTDFTIRLKHTSRSSYVGSSDYIWESTGFTTVYQGSPTVNALGYITFTFTTPFVYDGVSNLMLDYSYRGASNTSNRPTVAGTTRANYRVISLYTSSTANGDPLTWAGTTPTAIPDTRTADIRLDVQTFHALTPASTGSFSNGTWTGSLSLANATTSAAIVATDAALTGASNSFEVVSSALALATEPAFTGGLSNTLSWNQPASGLEYEVERSTTPDFASPVSSGYLSGSTTAFSGLASGQIYHYRVRMRRQGAAPWTSSWSPALSSTQDAVPPVITVGETTTSAASATLTGATTDATSGVASVTVGGNTATTADAFATWTRGLTDIADGPNSFTITAKDNAVPPNTATATAIIYRVASPTGDPNNNGIESLLEHALGIPAAVSNPRAMLPAATVQTDGGTGDKYLTMQFRRRLQRGGLAYSVQTSTDLVTWDNTGASVQEVSAVPTGDGVTEMVTVRVTPAITAAKQKFVRLQVTTN